MLGMAVDVFSSDGEPCKPGQSGELVCTQAFPCQPVGFWPLTGFGADEKDVQEAKERYQKSYFSEFKGIWCKLIFIFMESCEMDLHTSVNEACF